eukprot:scaffold60589_cov58-Phaeocystis_antarctica.AAC.2
MALQPGVHGIKGPRGAGARHVEVQAQRRVALILGQHAGRGGRAVVEEQPRGQRHAVHQVRVPRACHHIVGHAVGQTIVRCAREPNAEEAEGEGGERGRHRERRPHVRKAWQPAVTRDNERQRVGRGVERLRRLEQ